MCDRHPSLLRAPSCDPLPQLCPAPSPLLCLCHPTQPATLPLQPSKHLTSGIWTLLRHFPAHATAFGPSPP